jgi:chromosome partitioning protein
MSEKKPKIIAITNQKGGVAKTTTSVNLASSIAVAGVKTLIIDLDPQGNASTGLGFEESVRTKTIYDLLITKNYPDEITIPTNVPNLDIITSDINLSAAEIELLGIVNKEAVLNHALSDKYFSKYEYIIIDCPPSLGQLTINALTAASGLIIPLQCEFYALEGLTHLLRSIDLIQNNLNKNLKILGVLLSMYDKRNRLTEEVEKDVRNCLGEIVFETVIPRNVRISEAPSHGKPVILYDPSCSGSKAYNALAFEFFKRERIIPNS